MKNVARVANEPFFRARQACESKVAKYKAQYGDRVVPFVAETSGAIFPESLRSFFLLTERATGIVPALVDFTHDIAALVLKGNARTFAGWAREKQERRFARGNARPPLGLGEEGAG